MKPPIMTLSPISIKPRVLMLANFELAAWGEIVSFHDRDPSGVPLPPYDCRVVLVWIQVCDNRGFESA